MSEKNYALLTASKLFAGSRHNPGDNMCYFCGADCDDTYLSADYIKPTFSNRDIVKCPGSEYVCRGCVESLGWGDDEMTMLDGSIRKRNNARGMAPRLYSWILTEKNRVAFTKGHISLARLNILTPPQPPFSIILADSEQKQLIFRASVAMSMEAFPVMLEEEIIDTIPELLRERLALATHVVAATGKPSLLKKFTIEKFIRYEEYHGNIHALEAWQKIQNEPLSRLAAWLSKPQKEAQDEYPAIKRG